MNTMKIYTQKTTPKTKGFTLIEALVSLGLFSIVVVAASGIILSVINSNKKNQAISSVVNNLNYSIESMVRDIKTGYRYHCNFDYTSGRMSDFLLDNYKVLEETCVEGLGPINNITLVSTITGVEQIVKYELVGTGQDAYIQKTLYEDDGLASVTVTSYPLTDTNNITISSLGFTIRTPQSLIPVTEDPVGQPSVFLVLTGTTKVNQTNISDFFIQTFISQRVPNFI